MKTKEASLIVQQLTFRLNITKSEVKWKEIYVLFLGAEIGQILAYRRRTIDLLSYRVKLKNRGVSCGKFVYLLISLTVRKTDLAGGACYKTSMKSIFCSFFGAT